MTVDSWGGSPNNSDNELQLDILTNEDISHDKDPWLCYDAMKRVQHEVALAKEHISLHLNSHSWAAWDKEDTEVAYTAWNLDQSSAPMLSLLLKLMIQSRTQHIDDIQGHPGSYVSP